jgi:hypothetical protein
LNDAARIAAGGSVIGLVRSAPDLRLGVQRFGGRVAFLAPGGSVPVRVRDRGLHSYVRRERLDGRGSERGRAATTGASGCPVRAGGSSAPTQPRGRWCVARVRAQSWVRACRGSQQVRAWTSLEAAEVAWLRFHEALDLRGDGPRAARRRGSVAKSEKEGPVMSKETGQRKTLSGAWERTNATSSSPPPDWALPAPYALPTSGTGPFPASEWPSPAEAQ